MTNDSQKWHRSKKDNFAVATSVYLNNSYVKLGRTFASLHVAEILSEVGPAPDVWKAPHDAAA
jgi:hypothetical protein